VFERFTERARQVVVLAQGEARSLRHNYIGTEHLLLGLLREEEGLAARVLAELGVTLDHVRGQVALIVGEGDEVTAGQIPFTPRAKKVLELSLREAHSLGHGYIGTEHILLGLAREQEGVAARMLLDLDVDRALLRDAVIKSLGGPEARPPRPLSSWARPWPRAKDLPAAGRSADSPRYANPVAVLVAGWLLFALALGAGILVGWAIWG
jgi:ATP-dependent Clp protease ATP-binding subunit ClpC